MINEKYISKFLFLIFLAGIMGFAIQAEAATVETNSGCLNFRSSKGSWGSLRKTKRCLRSGTQVRVIGRHKRNKNYLKVRVGKRVGYIWVANVNQSSSDNNRRNKRTYVGNNKQGQVQTGSGCLNFRRSNSPRGSLYKTNKCLKSGTNLKILGRHERNNKYLKVQIGKKIGYVWDANVNLDSPDKKSNNNDPSTKNERDTKKNNRGQTRNAKVHTKSDCLNFRRSSTPRGSLRKTKRCLPPGTKIKVTGRHKRNKKYLQVEVNGVVGYVWAANVVENNSDENDLKDNGKATDKNADISKKDPNAKPNNFKLPDDLPDFNLGSHEISESKEPKAESVDSKLPDSPPENKIESDSVASENTTNGEKVSQLDKATAKYEASLKEAFKAEVIARTQEEREKKLRFTVGGKTIPNKDAQREATQKRLAADSLLKKAKKQHANLLKMGAKDIKKPFLDLPPRNKKEAAELLANQKVEKIRLKKIAEANRIAAEKKRKADAILAAAEEKRKAEADRIAAEKKRKADEILAAAEEKRKAEADRIAAEKKRKADATLAAAEEKRKAETDRIAAEKRRKAEDAKKNSPRARFERAAKRKSQCFRGEQKLKASPLWAIMKEKNIPSPYGTTWKGFVPKSKLPWGACTFKGVCGGVTITTKFNKNGTFTGSGRAKNSSGQYKSVGGDRGVLLACYRKGRFYIHSRSLIKSEPFKKTLVTSKTRSWNLEHEKLGNIRMNKVGR